MTGKARIRLTVLGFLLIIIVSIGYCTGNDDDDGDTRGVSNVSAIDNSIFDSPTLEWEVDNRWKLKKVWKDSSDIIPLTAYYLVLKNGEMRDIPGDFIIIQDNVCEVERLHMEVPSGAIVKEIDLAINVPNPCKVATKIDVGAKIDPFLNNPLNSSFSFNQLQNWKFDLTCDNDTYRYNSFQIRLNLQIQHEIGKSFEVDTNTIDHENKIVTLKCI